MTIAAAPTPSEEIIELRRYRLRPGQRETLIDLFDAEFIVPQEAAGMRVIGQFRDLDDSESFTWFRGFPTMDARRQALADFYGGPVWQQHGPAANVTMVNSDNVLLLRPAYLGGGLPCLPRRSADSPAVIEVAVASLAPGGETDFAAAFRAEAAPRLAALGAGLLGALVTEHSPNSFPRLPVREGESTFVWVAEFATSAAYDAHRARRAADPLWRDTIFPALDRRLWRPLEILRLSPTRGSALGSYASAIQR